MSKFARRSKIADAIRQEGPQQFRVAPLFYSLVGSEGLTVIETDLIKEHRAVENGYNVAASGGNVGPYGPKFSAAVSAAQSRPEVVAKRLSLLANPEWRKKRADAIRAAYANPDVKEFCRSRQNPPDPVANGKLITAAFKRPEVKVKLRARRRPVITDDMKKSISTRMRKFKNTDAEKSRVSQQMLTLFADDEFRKKHLKSTLSANTKPERRARISAYRTGGCWITDGKAQKFLTAGEAIPAGWKKGRLRRPSTD